MSTLGITDRDVRIVLDYLIEHNPGDEPIDDFLLCRKNLLLSSLKTPFQRCDIEDGKEDFIDKSSRVYFYLIENHCLPMNGNKRLATQALLLLALLNNYAIKTDEVKLYAFPFIVTYLSKYVGDKEKIIFEIKEFIRDNLVAEPNNFDAGLSRQLISDFNSFLVRRE